MKHMFSTCREVRRSLLLLDSLDAVERGFLDMHLKRCPACHGIAEELARIEAGPGEIEEISEERMQHVYRRLTPAVHEISTKLSAPKKPWAWLGFKPAFAMSLAVAVALALVFVFLFQGVDLRTPAMEQQPALVPAAAQAELPVAFVDRCEGRVRIDGRDMFGGDRFTVQVGTRIEVEKDARFSFHVGTLARVALVGETSWRLEEATGDLLAMRLDAGKLAMDFNSQSGRLLTVATTDARIQVKGTVFTVEASPSGHTRVGVMEGLVEVVPRQSARKAILVGEDRFVTVPGSGEFEPVTDVQRSLVAELRTIGRYPEELTRMVRFDGNPQKARVEVDGRVVGTTPLAVRLPEGSFAYKLTAPGMEPVVGRPHRDDGDEEIAFAMLPAYDYQPAAVRHSQMGPDKPRPSRRSRAKLGKASKKTPNLFTRARAAMTAGDIPRAIALLRQANDTATGRKLVTGLALLAECYSAVGTYDKAADALDRIVDEMPGSVVAQNARYEIGRLAMDQLGDYSRAKGAFTAYVASNIGGGLKEDAYYSLCELDGRLGEHRNALHCFNQFLRSFSGGRYEPSARLWRGALYQDVEGRFAQAEDDLLAFVQARPSHPRTDEARYRIALGRYQNGDKRGAMGMIREYLHHHPNGKYRLRVERLRLAIIDPTVSLQSEK